MHTAAGAEGLQAIATRWADAAIPAIRGDASRYTHHWRSADARKFYDFAMIHEFQRIVPVETPVGYGSLLYVESGGPLANDIFAVVLEDGGKIRHFRSDQVRVLDNPTMDIVNEGFKGAGEA